MRSKYLIGIDPDLHKSGVAIWDSENKNWLMHDPVPNENLVDVLLKICDPNNSKVYIEAGWMNKKANFRGGNYREAQAKARNVGENHASGKMLVKFIEKAGFQVFLVRPLSKGKGLLKSVKGSWTEVGKKNVADRSGIKVKMNGDSLDAVFIVLHFMDSNQITVK